MTDTSKGNEPKSNTGADNDKGQDESVPASASASARRIQDAWKRHISRRHEGSNEAGPNVAKQSSITAKDRWGDALMHAETRRGIHAAGQGDNDVQSRWKRTVHFAARLQLETRQTEEERSSSSPLDIETKALETQHWLELIDGKHRYGSNLKYYHKAWLAADTQDNFFRWLDRGGGKDLSLDECPRERLEQERIIYLSPEQRRNYLVRFDEKGLLRWVRNDELVDTSPGLWTEAGDGKGIVHQEPSAPVTQPNSIRRTSFITDGGEDNQITHYNSVPQRSSNKLTKMLREHFTIGGIQERLLRKTTKRNTWIYVADRKMNLYVGIKDTGTFQHSSFLSGGLVVSAGLLKVHKGLITKLSPLSGHYRTKIDSFMKFVESLEDQGADLHRVQISKAEVALWGLENWKKAQKRRSALVEKTKSGITDGMEKVKSGVLQSGEDGVNWKMDIILGRKQRSNGSL